MIKQQLFFFLLRWLVSGLGMWICISLFGEITSEPSFWTYVLAGLIFALVDVVVKPFVSIIALPLAIITLGLWSILISIGMVWLAITLLPGVSMGFWSAVLSSIVMSIVNSLANILLPVYRAK